MIDLDELALELATFYRLTEVQLAGQSSLTTVLKSIRLLAIRLIGAAEFDATLRDTKPF